MGDIERGHLNPFNILVFTISSRTHLASHILLPEPVTLPRVASTRVTDVANVITPLVVQFSLVPLIPTFYCKFSEMRFYDDFQVSLYDMFG